MSDTAQTLRAFDEAAPARVRDYVDLLKPRVMSLVVFTGLVGVMIAPGHLHPFTAALAVLAIALGSGAAGCINMWYERDLDALMARTANRPLPAGRVAPDDALALGVLLSIFSVLLMAVSTNFAAAALLAAAILFYVFVYTVWLKRRTPQNIVIGGAAGAFPPMIGWAAVTGDVSAIGDRPVRPDLPVDAAALLGAGALSQRRLSPRRRADAAGGGGPARDQAADADLHPGAAAGGAGADADGRGRLALRRRRPGARASPSSAMPSRCGARPTTRPATARRAACSASR